MCDPRLIHGQQTCNCNAKVKNGMIHYKVGADKFKNTDWIMDFRFCDDRQEEVFIINYPRF